MSEIEIKDLKDTFREIDTDNTGLIRINELKEVKYYKNK